MRVRKSTEKQQKAVRYCEQWLCVEFEGDINNYNDCNTFLDAYLEDAKQSERELSCEFDTYLWGD